MANSVGPRAAKDDFMRALSLDSSNSQHEGYYRQMREQAINVYNALNNDRNSLIPEKRGDPSIQPPFFWHHISRERQQWAIIQIWNLAAPGTIARGLFDRGRTDGEHGPNWVILWLLYSVFRSRDIRNNRNRRAGEPASPTQQRKSVYDPARDRYRVV